MKTILSLLVSICFITNIFSQTPQSPVGVQLYSFREQFKADVRGTMQRIKDLGIKEVECAGFYNQTPQEFKKNLDEFGLKPRGNSL